MTAVLRVRGLTKRFGAVVANDAVDLDVAAGEIVALLGHNGAGKTTLVRQVVGLATPTAGTVTVAGTDVVAHPAAARTLTSVQPQAHVPLSGLTPRQAVGLVGRLRRGRPAAVDARVTELFARLRLDDWLDRRSPVGDDTLTGGVRRLVAFCMAAVAPGPLVVLDEPTNDVDPSRRQLLWAELRRLADAGHALLVVTHNATEAERVVDRAVVLHRGRVRAAGTPTALAGAVAGRVRLDVVWGATPPARVPHAAAGLRPEPGGRWTTTVPREHLAEMVGWGEAMRRSGGVQHLAVGTAGLAEAYDGLLGPLDAATEAEVVAPCGP